MGSIGVGLLLLGEAGFHVVDDELGCAFGTKFRAVDREVVTLGASPVLVGVEVVIVGS